MLKNYLNVALRDMRRHAGHTVLNVAGLAVGMTCCLLIALYVHDEWSYDRFHAKADRIYRIVHDVHTPDGTRHETDIPAPLAPSVEDQFPEVLRTVRFSGNGYMFEHGTKRYQENDLFFADPAVFDVFSFPLLRGDPGTALVEPYSLVLAERVARKYFGSEDPLGQSLIADGEHVFTVTGIVAELPRTSHLRFDMLLSMSTGEALFGWMLDDWNFGSVYTYVLLPKDRNVASLEAKLSDFYEQHLPDQGQQRSGTSHALTLEPLTDIHLHAGNRLPSLYLFSSIAGFILLIACINFVNLATVRSVGRAREIGVRKVLGAQRRQLLGQFLAETGLLTLLALLLALVLTLVTLPTFEAFSGKTLELRLEALHTYILLLLALTLLVGLLAGSYPALILSGIQPIRALRGIARSSLQGENLRRSLVVFQFSITIALIAATAIVYGQLDYVRNTNLGFDKDQMLVLDFGGDPEVQRGLEAIKQQLMQHPAVTGAAASGNIPGDYFAVVPTTIETDAGKVQELRMAAYTADYDAVALYGMKLVAGRAFSRDFQTDSTQALMLNQAAVAALGFSTAADALGKRFVLGRRQGTIIGVVENFHYQSLHHPVEPLTLQIAPSNLGYLALHVETQNLRNTVAEVDALWKKLVPHRPFLFRFLDESLDAQYRAEERLGALVGIFAGLAVIIACLGLFALASFTAQKRTKEIGIRKVLGASVPSIVALLSTDFLKLVGLALVVAAPLAYVAMQRWLESFAYRIEIGLGVFVLTGALVLLIALATVSYQSVRAAVADPVTSLRYE